MKLVKIFAISVVLLLMQNFTFAQNVKVDENLTHYAKVSGISGNLNSIGSHF